MSERLWRRDYDFLLLGGEKCLNSKWCFNLSWWKPSSLFLTNWPILHQTFSKTVTLTNDHFNYTSLVTHLTHLIKRALTQIDNLIKRLHASKWRTRFNAKSPGRNYLPIVLTQTLIKLNLSRERDVAIKAQWVIKCNTKLLANKSDTPEKTEARVWKYLEQQKRCPLFNRIGKALF